MAVDQNNTQEIKKREDFLKKYSLKSKFLGELQGVTCWLDRFAFREKIKRGEHVSSPEMIAEDLYFMRYGSAADKSEHAKLYKMQATRCVQELAEMGQKEAVKEAYKFSAGKTVDGRAVANDDILFDKYKLHTVLRQTFALPVKLRREIADVLENAWLQGLEKGPRYLEQKLPDFRWREEFCHVFMNISAQQRQSLLNYMNSRSQLYNASYAADFAEGMETRRVISRMLQRIGEGSRSNVRN